MKFVFIDKDEHEMDIIKNILLSYNIHYDIKSHQHVCMFTREVLYDIQIDISPEFYEYLCKEIENKLAPIELLEDCYELPDAIKPEKRKRRCKKQKTEQQPMFPIDFIKNDFAKMLMETIGVNDNIKSGIVKFDDLSNEEQNMLLKKLPIHVLKSNTCKIIKTEDGIIVKYVGPDIE